MRALFRLGWSLLFGMASCGLRSPQVEDLPISKQRQKISFLQKKLQLAEKEQKKRNIEVERLSDEVRAVELAYIRKQIDHFEEFLQKNPNKRGDFENVSLFVDERERLHKMLQKNESPYEAQIVLDRILQLITELGRNEQSM